ncbi:DUF1127 domain-containing protein [Ciceribacter sp. RN22]|uniref:Uncharacterized protein YjiS (DUF1127 family) n=1 Tax=Ciceribacter lividus TaxID=1197950 RepID=A0A6I7HUJ1_9HYPH|nr:DUF1127 domain-containing protein [Ciceribacter sp. RN22]MCO6178547.1 DUF1127 domain-containing protein [Ciceribacter sp. RN22]RCW28559.1 uncharacterized protein YjiS (DUF1127 family) [Ciceribacter lividus]
MTIDTMCHMQGQAGSSAPWRRRVRGALVTLFREMARRRRVRRTRIDLAGLTADQLRDIGLTQREADAEVRRSLFLVTDRTVLPK